MRSICESMTMRGSNVGQLRPNCGEGGANLAHFSQELGPGSDS